MPHVTMEYSANLESQVDFDGLCRAIHTTGIATGLFELGAVRVRAIKCDHYAIADLLPQNSFIDTSIRIGLGRSQTENERLGKAINTTPLSWNTNAMHPRIGNAANAGIVLGAQHTHPS